MLPPGLIANLSGVAFCPEAVIEAARQESGTEELEHPSCPATSEIGHTSTGYGVGSALAYASGKLYLAGPYHGASFSIVAIDPAVVGPFDLGVVIVRSALRIDPYTADASIDSAGSDPIPHIIDGIPLHLRDIRVYINRPQFTLNPTSCEPLTLASVMTGSAAPFTNPADITASVSDPSRSPTAKRSRSNPPSGSQPRVRHRGPGREPLGEAHLPERRGRRGREHQVGQGGTPQPTPSPVDHPTTGVHRRAIRSKPSRMPAPSIVGHAKAITPILPVPLEGPAYFVSHGGQQFPELVVVLQGYGVTVYLKGETFISKGGITSSTFGSVPDVPVGSFELTLPQGPYSALTANGSFCSRTVTVRRRVHGKTRTLRKNIAAKLVMPTSFIAQNGAVLHQSTIISVSGCKPSNHQKTRKRRS